MQAGPRKVEVVRKGFRAAPVEIVIEEGRTVEAEIRLEVAAPE